jgi:predicted ATP-grasp superfamily ATP-dependent carboligase
MVNTIKLTTPPIAGIAPNAFSRVVANSFLDNYSIICFKWRGETAYIARDMKVHAVEHENPETKIERTNAMEILNLPSVQEYMKVNNIRDILVYKSTIGVEELADQMGWNIIGNRTTVKDKFENKAFFRKALVEAGITPIPGNIYSPHELTYELVLKLQSEYYGNERKPLVFQIAEMTAGGGTGTAFISNKEEYDAFMEKLNTKLGEKRKNPIENITIAKFIEGESCSIAGCVTKKGTITARIQTQVQDIPEVRLLGEGSGLFCGHDWSYKDYDESLQAQAQEIARKFGDHLYKNGYKGIFGLDLMVNEEEGIVYPVECNPRYTDAFPILTMMQSAKGLLPMDYYHIAEHLNLDYDFDLNQVSEGFNQTYRGSQIILETKTNEWSKVTGDLPAGVYHFDKQQNDIRYVREGYRYEDILSPEEFLLTEGVPFKDTVFKPGARVLRLVRTGAMLKAKSELTDETKQLVALLYDRLQIVEIEAPIEPDEE